MDKLRHLKPGPQIIRSPWDSRQCLKAFPRRSPHPNMEFRL